MVEFELFAGASGKTIVGYDAARRVIYFDRRESGGPAVHESFPTRREALLARQLKTIGDLGVVPGSTIHFHRFDATGADRAALPGRA